MNKFTQNGCDPNHNLQKEQMEIQELGDRSSSQEENVTLTVSVHNRKSKKGIFASRWILCHLTFWGYFMVYALRVNLSVALPMMVRLKEQNHSVADACPNLKNLEQEETKYETGEFEWDEEQQGQILGAFFFGYILTHIPGGLLAEKYGGKWLFGVGVLWTAVFTLLTPLAAKMGFGAFALLRVLEGFGEGVTFPAQYTLFAHWFSAFEMSTAVGIAQAGTCLGIILTLPVAGILCDSTLLGGWPMVFYTGGLAGIIWFLFWTAWISSEPEQDPRISEEELKYIQTYRPLQQENKNDALPWCAMLSSIPVWALTISKLCASFSFYVLLTELPTFIKNIQHKSIEMNGFMNALLYTAQLITAVAGGMLSDYLSSKGTCRITNIKKIFQTIGCVGPAICLILLPLVPCDIMLTLSLLVTAMALSGFTAGGDAAVPALIAPQYAGTVMGIANGISNFSGLFGPVITGYLISNNETIAQWSKVFYISAAINIVGALVFLMFGSAETQDWAIHKTTSKKLERKEVAYSLLSDEED